MVSQHIFPKMCGSSSDGHSKDLKNYSQKYPGLQLKQVSQKIVGKSIKTPILPKNITIMTCLVPENILKKHALSWLRQSFKPHFLKFQTSDIPKKSLKFLQLQLRYSLEKLSDIPTVDGVLFSLKLNRIYVECCHVNVLIFQ